MIDQVYLNDGDATFSSKFVKVCYGSTEEQEFKFSFSPGKGKKFVTLLLGEVDKKANDCDIEGMLNRLGFYRREDGKQ